MDDPPIFLLAFGPPKRAKQHWSTEIIILGGQTQSSDRPTPPTCNGAANKNPKNSPKKISSGHPAVAFAPAAGP